MERFIYIGWFLKNQVLAKIEYINQTDNGYDPGDIRENGNLNGRMNQGHYQFLIKKK